MTFDVIPLFDHYEHYKAIGISQAVERPVDLTREFNVTRRRISRLWGRFQATGTPADRPCSGRPRATTSAQDRFLVRHLRNCFISTSSTAQEISNRRWILDQTTRSRLHATGLRAYRPVRGLVLTRHHHEARLQWRRQRLHWTIVHHWKRVLSSYKSNFLLQRHDRRRRAYNRRSES